jgi:hypothetical protein
MDLLERNLNAKGAKFAQRAQKNRLGGFCAFCEVFAPFAFKKRNARRALFSKKPWLALTHKAQAAT